VALHAVDGVGHRLVEELEQRRAGDQPRLGVVLGHLDRTARAVGGDHAGGEQEAAFAQRVCELDALEGCEGEGPDAEGCRNPAVAGASFDERHVVRRGVERRREREAGSSAAEDRDGEHDQTLSLHL
jgi:hypothetical protein